MNRKLIGQVAREHAALAVKQLAMGNKLFGFLVQIISMAIRTFKYREVRLQRQHPQTIVVDCEVRS